MTKKTYDPAKQMIATRIDRGLLMQFDATAKACKLHRTDAMEAAMRTWMNGRAEVVRGEATGSVPSSGPCPLGYDAITGASIFKRGVGPRGGTKK